MSDKKSSTPSRAGNWLLVPFRILFRVLGCVAVVAVVAAFTPLPWKIYGWLGDSGALLKVDPQYLVVMGGGGVPSESGLMRTYAGAEAAAKFPHARVVVAMPGVLTDTNSSPMKMRDELVMRGVAKNRIMFEDKGRHTHEQAMNCFTLFRAAEHQPAVVVVTSPEHLRRCLMSFRKAGFTNVSGAAAYDVPVEADLRFSTTELKGKHIPDVGQSLMIRYQFWTNLELEARCLHEFAALAYYRLLGWI